MEAAANTYHKVAQKHRRDQLVLDHLDYVRHILQKLLTQLPGGVDEENLEAAGLLGLVEAAQQFDFSRNVTFTTFAYPRIRGAIVDELRRNSPLPQQMLKQIARIREASEKLPPPATPEDIARATEMSLAEVERCLEATRLTRVSLWEESAVSIAEIQDRRATQPETEAESAERKQVLADAIESLPEQERVVITLYYLEDLRLKEIGELIELSESRVSRILAKAQFRLQQFVKARGG